MIRKTRHKKEHIPICNPFQVHFIELIDLVDFSRMKRFCVLYKGKNQKMTKFVIFLIGISATIFSLWSTVPQISKSLKTKKTADVSKWLIISLIVGLSLGNLWNSEGRHRDRIIECHWCHFKYYVIQSKNKIYSR